MKRMLDKAADVAETIALVILILFIFSVPVGLIWLVVYLLSTAWHAGG